MNTQHRRVQLGQTNGDSIPIGRARVRLKLAALAYAAAHHGGDPSIDRAGVALLCESAIRYYETLLSIQPGSVSDPGSSEMSGRGDDHRDRINLKLAGLAYSSARVGVDANLEIARAGLGILCEAAIRYCEGLPTAPRGKRAVDPSLHLDSGT